LGPGEGHLQSAVTKTVTRALRDLSIYIERACVKKTRTGLYHKMHLLDFHST